MKETVEKAAENFVTEWFEKGDKTVEVFKAGVKWQKKQQVYSLKELNDSKNGYLKAKKEYQQKLKEEILKYNIWFHDHCIYYDEWNIRIPLGDKYPEVYTEEEIYEIYLKEQDELA